MTLTIFLLHFILGVLLFFIINWIGKHSYSVGYMEISIFVKVEEAPALNFLIRVLTPIVYIIIISAILYYLKLDQFVLNIYLVNVYYIAFRLFFNLFTNRGLLLNWYRQILYWVSILVVSYFAYDKLIKTKSNILPDFTTISNELWIIILVFLFQITNNIRLSQDGTIRRKKTYLKSRYNHFKKLYGKIIKRKTNNDILESIIYAIIIYEDFNRPKAIRILENIKQRITNKPHTLGVMQVKTNKIISDYKSVEIGIDKIMKKYTELVKGEAEDEPGYLFYNKFYDLIESYNGGSSYGQEISELFHLILAEFYSKTTDTIFNYPGDETP